MGAIKFPHASGNSMAIAAPATNPASDLELKLPATIGTANQYLKNSSTAGTLEFATLSAGKILQVVEGHWTDEVTSTSTTYSDWKSLAVTPASGSKVLVFITLRFRAVGAASVGYGNQTNFGMKVLRSNDGFSSNSTDLYTSKSDSGGKYTANLSATGTLMLAGTATNNFLDDSPGGDGSTAITYKVQVAKGDSGMGTMYFGEGNGGSIILMEVGS